jgi:hypothetical protein
MDTQKEAAGTVGEDKLVIGQSDVVEEVSPELRRVMTANSEALGTLPGHCLVQVPKNEG